VPRHPAGGTPARLAGLPQTQKLLWTALTAARREVVESQPRATVDAAAHAAAMAAMGTLEAAAVGEGVGEAAVEAAEGEGEGEGGDFWLGAALDLPAAAKGGARRWDFAATGFPYR
jgi:hypothetical protein